MLCPRCHGTHVVPVNGCQLPCPECNGAGELHCCDGLQEQPLQESGDRGQESDVTVRLPRAPGLADS